jgi:hypothetical protein
MKKNSDTSLGDCVVYKPSVAVSLVGFCFFVVLSCLSGYALYGGQYGYSVFFGALSLPFLAIFLISGRRSISVYGNRIEDEDIFKSNSILYGEVYQVLLGGSAVDAVQIYKSEDQFWPDLTVPYLIEDYEELARELVERLPPEVEVVDWMGITDEVDQGAKWNKESVGEA